jgi:hypothetical protein
MGRWEERVHTRTYVAGGGAVISEGGAGGGGVAIVNFLW